MSKKALIVWGGWDGHEPKQVGAIVERELKTKGFKNIYLLGGGFYNFVWSSFNVEDCKDGLYFLVDHKDLY